MLRSVADPRKATAYDRTRVSGSTPEGIPAPVQADVLDAQIDLLHTIGAGTLRPGAESDEAYDLTLGAVGRVLAAYDEIANDEESFLQWWGLVMPAKHEEHEEFWTATRVLHRWPLEDRSKWATQPCPECGLRTVRINPPRHRHALTTFICKKCDWRKTETDDEGLWASAFGLYADQPEKDTTMTERPTLHQELNIADALAAGRDAAKGIDDTETALAAFAAVAVPAIVEACAQLADEVAANARASFDNGVLLSGGGKLVAAAIRGAATHDYEPGEVPSKDE